MAALLPPSFLSLLFQLLLWGNALADCPAGPFNLHNFSYNRTLIDRSSARPYFIVLCDLATTVRLDPLMHPDVSTCHSHVHSVFGSNRFGPQVSLADSMLAPEELANTTCHIPADGSIYWAPSMYFHNRTSKKYFLVPVYMKAYYFNRGQTEPMALMPRGLRMIRGDPYRNTPLVPEHQIRNDTVNIFWDGSNMTGGFPARIDQGDWQTRTMFPNCWDGKNLVTSTVLKNTHMTFRSQTNGTCPPSHPVRIPQLFVEVNYQIELFANDPSTRPTDFLLSTGDRKGWTAHVDYISGWQQDTLDAALYTCPNTAQGDPHCAFHQFSSVVPAAPFPHVGSPSSARLYKPSPVEEVDALDHLLVTGEEARRAGMPVASCTMSNAPFKQPLPLMNERGVFCTGTRTGTVPPSVSHRNKALLSFGPEARASVRRHP